MQYAGPEYFSKVEILILSHAEVHGPFTRLKEKFATPRASGIVSLRFVSDGGAARRLDPHAFDQPPVDDRRECAVDRPYWY
jgi:hypothetical protein